MARLLTTGFELAAANNITGVEDPGIVLTLFGASTIAADSTNVRSGTYAQAITSGSSSGNYTQLEYKFTGVLTRTYHARMAVRFTTFGAAASTLLAVYDTTSGLGFAPGVDTSGVVSLAGWSGAAITATGAGQTLALNTWYVIELSWVPSSGVGVLRIDGVQVLNGTSELATNTTLSCATFVNQDCSVGIDDWAVNDDQGASQNSWCGELGKIVLLKPASDGAKSAGMKNGAGGTTNLYQGVNNTPPVGVVLASATATSQIKDATSIATDTYSTTMQTYTVAGLVATDQVTLVQGLLNHGNSTVTSRTDGITVVSNPAIAEATGATGTTAAATFPTGWTTLKSIVSYAPAVTLGTAPVLKFRKATASTDSAMADFMGLYVEYRPRITRTLTASLTPAGSLARLLGKNFAASLTPAGSLAKRTARAFAASLTAVGGLLGVKGSSGATYTQTLTASLTPAGSLAKRTARAFAASLTAVGGLGRAMTRSFTASFTPVGSIVKRTARAFAGSMTPTGALNAFKAGFANFKTLTAALTPSGSLAKIAGKTLTGALTSHGTLSRGTSRTLSGSMTPVGTLRRSIARVLSASLTPAGAISRGIARKLAGALSFVGNLIRFQPSHGAAIVTLTDSAVSVVALTDGVVYQLAGTDARVGQVATTDTTVYSLAATDSAVSAETTSDA